MRRPAPRAQAPPSWVYGAHRWRPATVEARLAHLPGAARHLFLSVEDGRRLIMDDPADGERLADLLDLAEGRLGLTVDAMLLQDPSWASDPEGAIARVARAVTFQRAVSAAGRHGFRGLHFDIEPFSTEEWGCGAAGDRRVIVRRLQAVFARIRHVVQASGMDLRLSAALPWWVVSRSAELPDAAPRAWLGTLDEIVLMVYGDPGGPLVGESAAGVLARAGGGMSWAGIPPGHGFWIGMATYEYASEAALAASMHQVAAGLDRWPGFRGLAVFAYGQPFNSPLVTIVQGRVVDGAGRPVAGATIRGNDEPARSSRCGVFELRGLPAGRAQITVEAAGFAPSSVTVAGLVPGHLREIPPIALKPRQTW
jgi:Carboxypeptidase regulatory-like domain